MSFLEKIFGSFSTKELKKIRPIADKVLALDEEFSKKTDKELQAMTPALKERLAAGESLDDILPEAFATCREAAWRVLGMKHFPVQIIGGIVLHRACIAEMKTGEGKTLVATLPVYLNALTGKGVHVVTVNDYLAKRDSEWMGKVYRFLGLSVGLIVHGITNEQRRAAYQADITYGTNNEFGFDYLRDNMVTYKEQMVQRGHYYAIVDEVDSILIDEARTPLIISGQGEKSTDLYGRADRFVCTLQAGKEPEKEQLELMSDEEAAKMRRDYVTDEKQKTCNLSEEGVRIDRGVQYFISDSESSTAVAAVYVESISKDNLYAITDYSKDPAGKTVTNDTNWDPSTLPEGFNYLFQYRGGVAEIFHRQADGTLMSVFRSDQPGAYLSLIHI